jgi:hypothetical protein
MTTSGIETATFWLVAQGLKQLRHRVSRFSEQATIIYQKSNGELVFVTEKKCASLK